MEVLSNEQVKKLHVTADYIEYKSSDGSTSHLVPTSETSEEADNDHEEDAATKATDMHANKEESVEEPEDEEEDDEVMENDDKEDAPAAAEPLELDDVAVTAEMIEEDDEAAEEILSEAPAAPETPADIEEEATDAIEDDEDEAVDAQPDDELMSAVEEAAATQETEEEEITAGESTDTETNKNESDEGEHDASEPGADKVKIDEPFTSSIDKIATADTTDDFNEDDQSTMAYKASTSSKELKSILQLAKEAKLDTNIAHKRESRKIEPTSGTPTEQQKEESDSDEKLRKTAGGQISLLIKKNKRKRNSSLNASTTEGSDAEEEKKVKKLPKIDSESRRTSSNTLQDKFCWICHRDDATIFCKTCPRSYHQKCLKQTISNPQHWPCPECVSILKAESTKTRSITMKHMTLEHLCGLLKYALKRMMQYSGAEPFLHPVNEKQFPDYNEYVVYPMDLTKLQNNIRDNLYGSTEAFMADAKWILHNSIIFNSYQSKLTSIAKSLFKICKQEMAEIETCAECYLNANTKKETWFIEVCSKPHVLLWAKLKGFPYWPAKAMCTNSVGLVDVRFFGAHDRAWVPVKECFLYSQKDPNSNKQKRNDIAECIKELELHLAKIREIYGSFHYAPYRVLYDPENEVQQLKMFIPNYNKGRRTSSVSARIDYNDDTPSSTNDSDSFKIHHFTPKSSKSSSVKSDGSEQDKTENDISGKKADRGSHKKMSEGKSYSDDEDDDEISQDTEKNCKENDDFETQIDPNTEPDRNSSFYGFSTKSKAVGAKYSEEGAGGSRKRIASEEFSISPSKLSRRNSDQSIQSDSSRLSNISERINKLDVPEDVEISLGNEKPGRVSASDWLMMKMNQTENATENKKDEDRKEEASSSDNSDSDQAGPSKSGKSIVTNKGTFKELFDGKRIIKIKTYARKPSKGEEAQQSSNKKVDSVEVKEEVETAPETQTAENESADNEVAHASKKQKKTKKTLEAKEKKSEEPFEECPDVDSTSDAPSSSTVKVNENIRTDDSKQNGEETPKLTKGKTKSFKTSTPISTKEATKTDEHTKTVQKTSSHSSTSSSSSTSTATVITSATTTCSTSTLDVTVTSKSNKEPKKIQPKVNTPLTKTKLNNEVDLVKKNTNKATVKIIDVSSIINAKDSHNDSCVSSPPPSMPVEVQIKSESESESEYEVDDREMDTAYMEAKKRYLSALNISYKPDIEKKKPKAAKGLATRSRAKGETLLKASSNASSVASSKSVEEASILQKREFQNLKEITIKPLSSMQNNPKQQRARKSFPSAASPANSLLANKQLSLTVKKPSVINNADKNGLLITSTSTPIISSSMPTISISSQQPPPLIRTNVPIKQTSSNSTSSSTTQQNWVNQQLHTSGGQIITMIQHQQHQAITNSTMVNGPTSLSSSSGALVPSSSVASTSASSADHQHIHQQQSNFNEEISLLRGIVPENLSKAVSELMCRGPPKLKPRPAGPLSATYDEGVSSNAGPIASQINSVSHRLSDYFRGLLIETIKDIGACTENPETQITALKQENEELKHRHAEEILEIKKNVSSVLRDIQKSIMDERNKLIEDTRSACEVDAIKRIEETKLKQWCANCLKEAQFYCCWNTSYCDYPCQQKHWLRHMKTCTQKTNQSASNSGGAANSQKGSTSIVLRPTNPPKQVQGKSLIGKPTKVMVRPGGNSKPISVLSVTKPSGSTGPHTITLLESTPGNYEILGNNGPISVGGKLIANTSIFGKIKPGNVLTVTSPSPNSNQVSKITSSNKVYSSVPSVDKQPIVVDDNDK